MGAGQIIVSADTVFAMSGSNGDMRPHTQDGFYAYDTRFLSSFRLTVDQQELNSVGSDKFDHSAASFYNTPLTSQNLPATTFSIVRDRYVAEGLHEDISIVNHGIAKKSVNLEISFDSDFADIFEVRAGSALKIGKVTVEKRDGQHLCLLYRRRDFRRETCISFSSEPRILGKRAVFDISLKPKDVWKTCVTVLPVQDSLPQPMKCVRAILGSPFGAYTKKAGIPVGVLRRDVDQQPLEKDLPHLATEHVGLFHVHYQALADLRALRMKLRSGYYMLAAGLPWFMTVFGRDSIIASIQTKLLGPELMIGTLHTLAGLQSKTQDKFREGDPGKIPHEIREGELSILADVPFSRYYGSIDATPLFIVLLWEAYQWTGDRDLLRQLLPAAEAAVKWIDRYGDIDDDGFIEYKGTRHGLMNQGWKDSEDSVSFADGQLAEGPIALAEVQGYVYDAKRKMAEIYRVMGDAKRADTLEKQAQELRERFNKAFWMPSAGYIALALDGQKRQVDCIASNAGQCLWSGILDSDKARKVVEKLMAPDMFSGWGIRTLSTEMARYNPLSYHNGSVWPHDNSLIAAGMVSYGFRKQANEIAFSIMDAAAAFGGYQLPELFSGYPRREYSFPVPYPGANAPQAWASGAVVYLLETLLGVLPAGDRLLQEAPSEGLSLSLDGVSYRGSRHVL